MATGTIKAWVELDLPEGSWKLSTEDPSIILVDDSLIEHAENRAKFSLLRFVNEEERD